MGFIPIMLNVKNRKLVVIGGGRAALLKVKNLVKQGTDVCVIAEEFSHDFEDENVRKIRMRINDADQISPYIDDNSIVVIATDDPELNSKMRQFCKDKGILYNSVDEIDSPFIFPASFTSNGVTLAVATGGRSPSLTRFLRDVLKEDVEKYAAGLPVIERLRKDVPIDNMIKKAAFFKNLFDQKMFWELISNGNFEEAYSFGIEFSKGNNFPSSK